MTPGWPSRKEGNSNPIQSNPIQSNPIQSNPIQSNPIQSNPIQSNPIQSNPIQSPSHGTGHAPPPPHTKCERERGGGGLCLGGVRVPFGTLPERSWTSAASTPPICVLSNRPEMQWGLQNCPLRPHRWLGGARSDAPSQCRGLVASSVWPPTRSSGTRAVRGLRGHNLRGGREGGVWGGGGEDRQDREMNGTHNWRNRCEGGGGGDDSCSAWQSAAGGAYWPLTHACPVHQCCRNSNPHPTHTLALPR